MKTCAIYGVCPVVLSLAGSACAQWMQQPLTLAAGWNSIFLRVDPAPDQADLLFADPAIERNAKALSRVRARKPFATAPNKKGQTRFDSRVAMRPLSEVGSCPATIRSSA